MKKSLFKILVSVVLISIILYKVDRNVLVENLKMLDLRYAPLIVGLLVANYVISSIRWKSLLQIHENTSHVSTLYLIYLYFIGSFFNNFMPTSIGGDVYKIVKLSKKVGNAPIAFASTFVERFSGVLALLVLSLFAMYQYIKWYSILAVLAVGVGFVVGLKILKVLSTKSAKLQKLYEALSVYKNRKDIWAFAFFTSFLVQLCSVFTQYFIYMALGVQLPLLYSLVVFPGIILASFFIPSLNGIGVQDSLYMSAFKAVGVPIELSLSASILHHLFRLGVSLIGGVLYATNKAD